MRALLRFLLRLCFRFHVWNAGVLDGPGPLLLFVNHVSWLDYALTASVLDEQWRVLIPAGAPGHWWAGLLLGRRKFCVDLNSPFAVKRMAEYLEGRGKLMLFPEGRTSMTGSLMKFFDGTGLLLSHARAKVITGYIRGAERLAWAPNPCRKRWFPRVGFHFSEPLSAPAGNGAHTSESRSRLADWLRRQMVRQQFETELLQGPATLPGAIRSAARLEPEKKILQDSTLKAVTYRRLLVGAELLGNYWNQRATGARIGVLLPNVNALPMTLLGLWAIGKVPAVLNYTLGPASLLACARLAGVRQIISSRVFLEHLHLNLDAFREVGMEFLLLEDARAGIGRWAQWLAWMKSLVRWPATAGPWRASDPAVILFTSGSEGEPKGVELSHRNLLANIWQMLSVIDLLETDRFFNALPLFHSFGLTVGLLLPLARGVFSFLYVSPLHFRVVPSAFYNLNCTVLFGTNTFLAGYARKAHPFDFHRLRYVFAGAEKLQEATFNAWVRKFGVRILEGYGATECSPCISVNVPAHPRAGSVGQLLPGIEYRLEPVEGLSANGYSASGGSEVGRLFVRGPNVMSGYLNSEANAAFKSLAGWYDTGDVVEVDSGFLFVLGRLKRFAKISGEMISLAAVEDALAAGCAQYGLKFGVAVLTRPDALKGERLVAITNEPRLTLETMRQTLRARGLSNLAVPREIRLVEELPRLGTGKINLRELERILAA